VTRAGETVDDRGGPQDGRTRSLTQFGLWKIDGYDTTASLVTENFEVTKGSIDQPHEDENFFEFPYDWRRSNRESATAA